MVIQHAQFTIRKPRAKTSTERQRAFRKRHPNYYRDRRRAEQKMIQAAKELCAVQPGLLLHQAIAPAPAPGIQQPAPNHQIPLALPAARSEPLLTVQLPLFEQAPEPAPADPLPNPADVVEQRKRAA